MCGICFYHRGIPLSNHVFLFDFFEDYLPSEFIDQEERKKLVSVSLSDHVMANKLAIPQIEIKSIWEALHPRGPDGFHCVVSSGQQYRVEAITDLHAIKKQQSLLVQSILSLRGGILVNPLTKSGCLLYNGQVYHCEQPKGPKPHQNDSVWLFNSFESIPDESLSLESLSSLVRAIRGDFAFVYQRHNRVFFGKDLFGKKSLLIGFEEQGMVVTSVPLGEFESKQQLVQEDEKEWVTKYKSEWNNSKSKSYFQIPKNSLIEVEFTEGRAIWNRSYIYTNTLAIPFSAQSSIDMEETLSGVDRILKQSILELVINIREYVGYFDNTPYKETQAQEGFTNAHVAVLFSGGLDSTLIARLLDLILPEGAEIDLLNIVFTPDAPDRITAIKALQELRSLSKRKYNLILRDQTLDLVQEMQSIHMKLIYPKNTHMDFNISAILRIASELKGVLYDDQTAVQSPARVILSGLGADELFSGYSRYRVAYLRGGVNEQQKQMIFDLDRLWIRNLGRDDRAVSSQSKEIRYPFLYSPLVEYLKLGIELQMFSDYTKPKGQGDKLILREMALRLGLQETSKFKKTAIQFGTRLAKQSNIKAFGSNRKAKGTLLYQVKK